ncbi:vWA domain-containing protein [Virgibacillus sp. L01]|uniref:vWA domain-containing protein n=1 Tax=Virgibacillus sp. L01 TaxID=3457429 RepID=UPI003FD49F55
MKNLIKYISIFLFSFSLLLTGCSEDGSSTDKKQEEAEQSSHSKEADEKKEVTAPEAAIEPAEMVKEGPGELFSAEDMNPEKIKKAVESLPKDLKGKEAHNYLIHLLAADYGPAIEKYENFNPSFLVDDAPEGSEDEEIGEEEKELQVALLMDASGSMGGYVGGEMKMKAAKDSLKQFIASLPPDAKTMVRVYGHKGTGSDADKKMSCSSSEVVYPLSTYNRKEFNKALSTFKPAGWTPLAASIRAAQKDLQEKSGDNVKNVVYIISDGEETCGGDPVKAAKQLHGSGIATAVNIIGFDVENEAQAQLKKVAEAGGGTFTNVDSGKDLVEVAGDNISEALEAAELNMWSALEGVDLTWDAIHMNDDLDAISADFGDLIVKENSLLETGLEGLIQTKKITKEEADEIETLIKERQDKLDKFNEGKEKELEKRIEEKKQKARDSIDQVRREKAKD